jgi:8-oxo-dGTP diphosphatase
MHLHLSSKESMIIGVKAFMIFDKKILLILRDNDSSIPDPDTWGLPGGAVEEKESFIEALQRELYEELHIEPQQIIYIGKEVLKKSNIVIRYMSKLSDDEFSAIQLGDEGQRYGFFTIDEALKLPLSSVTGSFFHKNKGRLREIVEQGRIPQAVDLGLSSS